MKTSKEQIEDFEKEYIWFPLKYAAKEIDYMEKNFIFDEKGFSMVDKYGINYTLNEMDKNDIGLLWFLLPSLKASIEFDIKENG